MATGATTKRRYELPGHQAEEVGMSACASFIESPVSRARCGRCGHTAVAHRGLVSATHVIGRVNETFDRLRTFDESHAVAVADMAEFFQERLAANIADATADALADIPQLPAASEIADLLSHQVAEIRALADGEDVDQPDLQARQRLVKLAGLATAFAEQLDRHLAKHETCRVPMESGMTQSRKPKAKSRKAGR